MGVWLEHSEWEIVGSRGWKARVWVAAESVGLFDLGGHSKHPGFFSEKHGKLVVPLHFYSFFPQKCLFTPVFFIFLKYT